MSISGHTPFLYFWLLSLYRIPGMDQFSLNGVCFTLLGLKIVLYDRDRVKVFCFLPTNQSHYTSAPSSGLFLLPMELRSPLGGGHHGFACFQAFSIQV